MVSAPQPVYIIAEAGVNHDGSEARARQLIDIAAGAGADAVKFQLFSPRQLVTYHAAAAGYQKKNLKNDSLSQLPMLEKLTLPDGAMARLYEYCSERRVDFLCTPFDRPSLDYLIRHTRMPYLKLASGEITNGPLLLAAARSGLPIILSTGMSDVKEIGVALSILHFGYTHAKGFPKKPGKPSPAALKSLRRKVTLLHCVSQYPAPVASMNLRAMDSMSEAFGLLVGLSDHSLGSTMAIAAAARGARVIEKHFTYDVQAGGPDHAASLPPQGLKELVGALRDVRSGLGSGEKTCRREEMDTRAVVRRSVVAATAIAQGAAFSEANLACKRPASGKIPPNRLWELLGKKAKRQYAADDFIDAGELRP